MSLKDSHMPNVSLLAPVLDGSCDITGNCTTIANSRCKDNSTCECVPGFVADSTNKKCLPGTLNYRTCLPHRVWLLLFYKETSRNFAHFPGFCFEYCCKDGNVLKTIVESRRIHSLFLIRPPHQRTSN
jgi:hypothetical protein